MASISWQRYQIDSLSHEKTALELEVRSLQTQAIELEKRGARINFRTCGDQKRVCVQVENKLRYGERGEYFVVKGY